MSNAILNIGICTVDAVARCVDQFPPPGGLRLFESLTLTTGGCAMNCSLALARMGLSCQIIIKVGDDLLGQFVLEQLGRHRIDQRGVIRAAGQGTAFTFVCVHPSGQRSFIHTMGTNASLQLEEIQIDLVRQARFCSVSGAMVMPALDGEPTAQLLAEAQRSGAITLLDTVYTDTADQATWQAKIHPVLPYLDFFVPSEPEARAITGLDAPAEMARYFQARGCKNVVIKLGS
ncbi:MAG: carbohydrate kinase family protein, partial [Phycisphaerae bacterium]